MSGLRAAQVLEASGQCRVRLFDKGRGVGGRTSLRRAAPFTFDHGAQYFTARDQVFRAQVDEWIEAGTVAPFNGPLAGIAREGSLQFKEAGVTERFVGVPGMNAMARGMAAGLEVEVGARVESLERVRASSSGRPNDGRDHGHDGWTLHFQDGRQESRFDAVLVTTPAPQAEPLIAASPMLLSAAKSVSMRPCWAAMVAFAERFEAPFDGAFIDEGPLSWACRNSAKKGRPEGDAWVLHASPDWTEAHLDLAPADVAQQLTLALGRAAGLQTPKPVHMGAHRWMYSGALEPREDRALFDAEFGLGLAGDWLNGSKVQGAWLSGQALAQAVLSAHGA